MSKDIKKDFIADTALSCFLTSGYGGTSVDEIVRAADISKGGFYWYFKSKEEIFLYLVEKWIKEHERELASLFSIDCPAGEKLNNFIEFYLEKADVPMITLIKEFFTQAKDEDIMKKLHDLITNSRKIQIIKNFIQEAVQKGEYKTVDVEAAAYVFIGMFEGIGMIWSLNQQDKPLLERTARTALNIYLKGISNV